MTAAADLLNKNIELFRAEVNRYGIYGLLIALITILIATITIGYQMTGEVTLASLAYAQANNFGLRMLNLLPFAFAIWGQYTGAIMARQASAIIIQETDELRAETSTWKQKSQHDTTHDPLTGLPNRALLYDQLHQALLIAAREQQIIAVLFMDLDGFNEVNNIFGHQSGDSILKLFAERLERLIPESNFIARLGGDEFALVLLDISTIEISGEIALRIQSAMESPFNLDNNNIEISASIGISHYPGDGEDADTLIQYAEIAMYAAKQEHKGYKNYSAKLSQDNPQRIMLMSELRTAINNNQLHLCYQPKVDMKKGEVISVETLVRWQHPQYGHISPGEFIPLAERTRLIKPLTNWVLTNAMQQMAQWRNHGLNIDMAINLSARDLDDPELLELISTLINNHALEPNWFTLEITESTLMSDPKKALIILRRLRGMNFQLSIDDFGTGYSSLAYLSKFPVQELKIDQTFVLSMIKNKNDYLIVKSTIDLGHNLGLKVIAEGVENNEIWQRLKERGCDIAQGYYISSPLRAGEFDEWLSNSQWHARKSA